MTVVIDPPFLFIKILLVYKVILVSIILSFGSEFIVGRQVIYFF